MNFARLVPAALLTSGTIGAAKQGPEVVAKITDTVKVVMVRYELSQLAQGYDRDAILEMPVPKPGEPEAFSEWVRKSMSARGGRDPALDLWEVPYRFDWSSGSKVMRSQGPDLQPGPCASGEPQDGADDLCEIVGVKQ